MTSRERTTRAHAKVNLALRVLGKRPDGYHDLWTVFDELELHDDLTWQVDADRPFSLDVVDAGGGGLPVPADANNLVLRAASALCETLDARLGGAFHLTKRIPAGAGLGGGSSDAAAALRLVAGELGIDPLDPRVVAVAKTIGADVPFFLTGGRACAVGRGDEVQRLADARPFRYTLLFPGYPCSTADVFRRWHRKLTDTGTSLDSGLRAAGLRGEDLDGERSDSVLSYLDQLGTDPAPADSRLGFSNDLEVAATAACPPLGALRARLFEEGLCGMHLSGSGSTFFHATDDEADRDAFADRLTAAVARWQRTGFDGVGEQTRVLRTYTRRQGVLG